LAKKSPPVKFYDEEKLKLINKDTLKLVDKYKVDMSIRELSPKTVDAYISDLSQWLIYVYDNQDNKCCTDITEDDLTEFFYYCKTQGNNSRRMKRRMSSISAFYKFLKKKRVAKDIPTDYIDRPKKDTDILPQIFLTQEQVDEIRVLLQEKIDKAEAGWSKHQLLTIQLYMEVSLSTMARVNAVRNLEWKQIDFDERVIKDVLEKEQRIVTLFFSEKVKYLMSGIREYRKENNIDDGGFLFFSKTDGVISAISASTLLSWTQNLGSLIGIPELHCHSWRKTGANILKQNGVALEDVSKLLHHLGTEVTMRYIQENTSKLQAEKDKFEV
jgi:site-specific recombinase XerD